LGDKRPISPKLCKSICIYEKIFVPLRPVLILWQKSNFWQKVSNLTPKVSNHALQVSDLGEKVTKHKQKVSKQSPKVTKQTEKGNRAG